MVEEASSLTLSYLRRPAAGSRCYALFSVSIEVARDVVGGWLAHVLPVWNAPGQPPCLSITWSISAIRRMVSLRAMTILW